MRELKATEGIWKLIPSEEYNVLSVIVIEGNETVELASVYHDGEFDVEVSEADANLMAASKDLYSALENITNSYIELVNSGDCGNWNPENDKEVVEAYAALAKARGEKE